ncbi:putative Ig domain-containing protein [Paucibacter sp. XJ19-41]|uniref:putative Ig domain-containing protein n=1 Tax=Paucibacter sp. XJ19-41 TaxID=2927824 RepID=UPI00234AB2F3|nr:putative Ig domain-containing protein [Paucibacter sp. XJ19-41]MDC6168856.1 putative Ig domain-containing protein [Paucibacter sp. XJ19-41]
MKPQARACSLLLGCAWLLLAASAQADVDSQRSKGVAWLLKQQRGDGAWASANGALPVQATAPAVLALRRAGLNRSPSFGAAGAWLANAEVDSVDSIARKIEGMSAAGLSAQKESDRLYAMRAATGAATWGSYGGNGIAFVDTTMGLAGLRLGDSNYAAKSGNTVLSAVCTLLLARVNVAAGKQALPMLPASTNANPAQGRPSVIATALMLAELRAIQQNTGFANLTCGSSSLSMSTVQAEAVAWLLDQQNANGSFGEPRADGAKGGPSLLVTALVYRALTEQAAPAQPQSGNALSWLLSQQDTSQGQSGSGSWRADALITAHVLAALPAAGAAQQLDSDKDGLPDVIEAQLGSNPAVADARQFLGTPGLSVPGGSSASVFATATVGESFSFSLGGQGPFRITTGDLPPGLVLNAGSGLITGTPQQAGSYSFDLAAAAAQTLIARIDVDPDTGQVDKYVPLPPWALLLMGGLLLAALMRRAKGDF